jgi:hypothetical protein
LCILGEKVGAKSSMSQAVRRGEVGCNAQNPVGRLLGSSSSQFCSWFCKIRDIRDKLKGGESVGVWVRTGGDGGDVDLGIGLVRRDSANREFLALPGDERVRVSFTDIGEAYCQASMLLELVLSTLASGRGRRAP